jgi:hypothetical protein
MVKWKGVRNKCPCSVLCCYPNRPRHGETGKRRKIPQCSRCPSTRQEPGNSSTHVTCVAVKAICSVSPQFRSKTALILDILLRSVILTPVTRHIVGFCIMIPSSLVGRSGDSIVGIATGYGLDDRGVGVRVAVGSRIFTSSYRTDRLWGPPNLPYNGYRGSFLGVKRPEREADHSPPTSAEVKKMWISTSTPPYVFMA